jgi:hypothetical protein
VAAMPVSRYLKREILVAHTMVIADHARELSHKMSSRLPPTHGTKVLPSSRADTAKRALKRGR